MGPVRVGSKYRFVYDVDGTKYQSTGKVLSFEGGTFILDLRPKHGVAKIRQADCLEVMPVPADTETIVNHRWRG